MERARTVESGFFPLDEELGLLPGSLTPHQQESLVHLSVQMPYAKACQMLAAITGVHISEPTARRQTLAAGEGYETVQQAQAEPMQGKQAERCACRGCRPARRPGGKEKKAKAVEQMVLSSDGALIPLVGGIWAEARTLVIAEVATEEQSAEKRCRKLSYFSRRGTAQTFGERAVVETERRGVAMAKAVAAVQDGATWLQDFMDLHRQDACRILDFAHAAEYLSEIASLVTAAGTSVAPTWLSDQLHRLKHEGPSQVLAEVQALREQHPAVEELGKKVAYLQKREQHMQYPEYQEQGWPIGSGMVESANKHLVQARLKGAGMHWEPSHVNPLLALRGAESNERWPEAWQQSIEHRQNHQMQQRIKRQQVRYQRGLRTMQYCLLLWRVRTRKPKLSKPTPSASAKPPGHARPAANHPWRGQFLAKK